MAGVGQSSTDVLVVGGGPAGASTAINLARAGHGVTVLERRATTSVMMRGDALVPGAIAELDALGIDAVALGANPVVGTRMWHDDRSMPVRWARDNGESTGAVWRRADLNQALLDVAAANGVEVLTGANATTPIVERGFVRGATASVVGDGSEPVRELELRCRFLVVADGARSTFGRGLGTNRERNWPYAVSTSCYFASDRSDADWIDIVLGVTDEAGNPVTGHGWVNPVGDGTVNVGMTILSSYRDVLGVNILKLTERFVRDVADRWSLDPGARLTEPVRRRTPLGGSVHPKMGPTFLVVGDAAGMANPFNSHGVRAALTTGRIAASVLDEALTVGNSSTLQQYPAKLDAAIGQYHKVGRLTARFLGRPRLLELALRAGMRSDAAMGAALRIATNELRNDRPAGAERAYRTAAMITRFAPSW